MKKLTLLLLAVATVLTLSQCKKKVEQVVPTGDRIVSITLDVKGGGSKIDVDPNTGEVAFSQNDVVYVGSGGKYVGKLTCRGTTFKGNLTNPAMNEPLYFYFLGNRTIYEDDFTPGVSTSCSFDIIDQTDISNMAVISFGISEEDFTGEGTYHSFFQNKGALVMFNVFSGSDSPTCIEGMKNYVEVNFATNSFEYSEGVDGLIKLEGGSGERWAILLPQNAVPAGEVYSEDGEYTGTRGAVPAISANGYLFEGIEVDVTVLAVPEGAIPAIFTVGANRRVFFSQGNLQYQATTDTWRFAEHQGDKIGNDNSNISWYYDGWIDLFSWGTSGWNNGNLYYHPYDHSYSVDYNIGYGYGPTDGENYNYNLSGTYAEADWGVHNAISNGGNQAGLWRTLQVGEWDCLFNTRETPSGIRFAKANVYGYGNGVIILPDNWDPSVYALYETNDANAEYTSNVIGEYGWSQMEANGVVFLPAAGNRSGLTIDNVGSKGFYWSTSHQGSGNAFYTQIEASNMSVLNTAYRYKGFSVRLVHDAH